MILADSNLIIYAASGNYPSLVRWFAENEVAVSAVSFLEVLGYHKLDSRENKILTGLFADLEVIYPDEAVFPKGGGITPATRHVARRCVNCRHCFALATRIGHAQHR